MTTLNHKIKLFFLFAGDLAVLWLALWSAIMLRYSGSPELGLLESHVLPFSIIFAVWLLFFGAFGLYDLRLMKNGRRFLYRLLRVMATNLIFPIALFYFLPFFEIEPRRNLFLIATLAILFLFVWRYLFNLLIVRAPASKILFFGVNSDASELAEYLLKNPQLGQKPVAFMAVNGERPPENLSLPYFESSQNFSIIIKDSGIDTIVISREIKENKTLVNILFQAIPLGISVVEFPSFYEAHTGKIPLSLIREVWFLENLIGQKKSYYQFFKRVLDIAVAIVTGCVTLVLLPFIAMGIMISTPHDVARWREKRARAGDGILFFRQARVGKNGKVFNFVKFRSHRLGAERLSAVMNEVKEAPNDPRQYSFGTVLRKTYLDELGQIWNILKGEMSFVGPRPERPEYVEKLKQKVPFYEMRLLVPPGITGWAQVNMEDDAAVEDAPEKMQYDLYYIKNRSLVLDLLIILKTIFTILRREGR